ncbi:hypothetical protein F7725_003735 [Dissostichus mawsoni]|uniref:Uncharacterized protein n=1 Tax=Dissostichus mawsoni TaxID=36200 RepID=A0A7J5YDP5_DISMA|nr:hypothetical protein F7725_003735 [Dissostichus mawsoni]
MRGLYKALTTVKAKCAFYKILKENQPELCDSGRVTRSLDKTDGFKKKENISSNEQEHLERVKSLPAQGGSKMNFNGIFSCGRGGHRHSL